MILKSIKKMTFLGLLLFGHIILSNPKFTKSAEQEFLDLVEFQKPYMPNATEQEVKKYLLAMSTGLDKRDSIISLPVLLQLILKDPNNNIFAAYVQGVDTAFSSLKQLMNIPQDVELLFLRDDAEDALYNILDRKVYISPRFFGDSPTKQLFKLIHELTHCQQHMREGAVAMCDGRRSIVHEHGAYSQAAQAISCPLCMQIIEDDLSRNDERSKLGYLTHKDIAEYKRGKHIQDICEAHKVDLIENIELKALLPEDLNSLGFFQKAAEWFQRDKKSIARVELDFKIGSIQDRLSTVKFN